MLVAFESSVSIYIPFAALISVMTIGIALQRERKQVSIRLSEKLNKLWVGAEIVLFVLVGATMDVSLIAKTGLVSVILLLGVPLAMGLSCGNIVLTVAVLSILITAIKNC